MFWIPTRMRSSQDSGFRTLNDDGRQTAPTSSVDALSGNLLNLQNCAASQALLIAAPAITASPSATSQGQAETPRLQ